MGVDLSRYLRICLVCLRVCVCVCACVCTVRLKNKKTAERAAGGGQSDSEDSAERKGRREQTAQIRDRSSHD